jgi:hypothetical protein
MAGARNSDTRYRFINNTVFRSEGSGVLFIHTANDTIENNQLEEVGYPFARSIEFYTMGGGVSVRRNTLKTDGAGGIGLLWGVGAVAELNEVSRSGLLVSDSQAIGGGKLSISDTIQLNWVHDNRGNGIRFDSGQDGVFGSGNQILANVAYNNGQGGIASKSNSAVHARNTALNNQVGVGVYYYPGTSQPDYKIYDKFPVSGSYSTNVGSLTRGNVGLMWFGPTGTTPPGTVENNVDLGSSEHDDKTPDDLVRDFANLDFRPKQAGALADSGVTLASQGVESITVTGLTADVGAYDLSATTYYYWIPGRQTPAASSPVPPHDAVGVKTDASLMFLGGARYGSSISYHKVYVNGEEKAMLPAANNTYTPESAFATSQVYFWSVDAHYADGFVVAGSNWSFTVA